LIVLRIVAIWNRNKIIVAMAFSVWAINIGFLIQGAARIRSVWVPSQRTCQSLNTEGSNLNLFALLITDIALLFIMLAGLLRMRTRGGPTFGLTQLLWKQGVIWLLIAIAAEVPPVVFIILDLNAPLNQMLQCISWVTMAIAATRIHRGLIDFTTNSTDIFDTREGHRDGWLKPSAIKETYQLH